MVFNQNRFGKVLHAEEADNVINIKCNAIKIGSLETSFFLLIADAQLLDVSIRADLYTLSYFCVFIKGPHITIVLDYSEISFKIFVFSKRRCAVSVALNLVYCG